jgi:uncharacterized membrane protein
MLISPLMGPILAAGLALAAGDVILGLRAIVNLALSCLVAVAFAVSLVSLLPFKEITGEIAPRTQPNTLDLVVRSSPAQLARQQHAKKLKASSLPFQESQLPLP